MGQKLNVFLTGGTGNLSISPEPDEDGFYDLGEDVTIVLTLDNGFTFTNWTLRGTEIGTSTTLVYTIERSDATIVANATGSAVADFDYGLRLFTEYCDDQNRKSRIEIEQKNWVMDAEEVSVKNVTYTIGTTDELPTDVMLTSRLEWDFQIVKDNPDLDFLLTLDPRKFRVKWYRNYVDASTYDFYWVGYLKTDFLERKEYRETYDVSVVATDGISDFNGYLTPYLAIDYSSAMTVISAIVNNSFKDGLPISECVRVFESNMDSTGSDSLFDQFTVNPECLIEDDVAFEQEGTLITYNQGKSLMKGLETMLSSWICRIFQWNGVWYIMRVMEYTKNNFQVNDFDWEGDHIGSTNLSNDQEFECIGNPVRRGEAGYTRFNANLKLGSISRPEETRALLYDEFNSNSFVSYGRGTTNTLRRWDYINAIVFDGNRGEEYAGVERNNENGNGYIRFWGTADGFSDTNLSSVRFRTSEYNTAVKNADVVNIQLNFRSLNRGGDDPLIPPPNTHYAPIIVTVGDYYLSWDGSTTFSWTLTENVIGFPVETFNNWDIVSIENITIPEDGAIEISLCQMITTSGTRHRYCLDWDNVNITLDRNDALVFKEIKAKAITDSPHSNEFENRETYIGDALTNLSSSAIILKDETDTPVSEKWFREEEDLERDPLLGTLLSDMVNLYGKNNYSLTANIKEYEHGSGVDFRKGLTYNGKKFILNHASLDDIRGIWEIQAFQLNEE